MIEVDGRDKMVDVYKWHLAHPGQNYPGLVYGDDVAHDNNRDAMGATLKLTENILNTWNSWHPQVLHDLHESVPYLYDNTVGDGPYNAWIDPILADEWEMIGWNNVSEMTKFGMPGVFTHGNFDTWSPGYLMFIAALHNGISRLYETFGNGGADTVERELRPDEYARTCRSRTRRCQRRCGRSGRQRRRTDGTAHVAPLLRRQRQVVPPQLLHQEQALDPEGEDRGTGRVRLPGGRIADRRAGGAAAHSAEAGRRDFARQRSVHGHRTDKNTAAPDGDIDGRAGWVGCVQSVGWVGGVLARRTRRMPHGEAGTCSEDLPRRFVHRSHGSAEQPALPIRCSITRYWSPNDPQKTPYDDTGWTFPELFNVQTNRVMDVKVLDAPIEEIVGQCAR